MSKYQNSKKIANVVHQKSVEILMEVGFCVPDDGVLKRLDSAGFPVNFQTQMVKLTKELLEEALRTLPKDVKLHDSAGKVLAEVGTGPSFMGAGTPVNVFDLHTGEQRASTQQDVRNLVTLQNSLSQVDIVRPTVTATDQGQESDLVEIAELLRNTDKPIVHRTLAPERIESAIEMIYLKAGGEKLFRDKPNFATLYCPISPGYFTPENMHCMLKWAEYGVPITLLSMAMGGASAPATLLGELVVINLDILAWMVILQILYPGAPLMYGSVSAVLDMKTGILPLGAPERGMINSGAAIMGNFYGMPTMCGGLSSDAKDLDSQAGFEKAVTAFPLFMEEASIIYGVGATDAGSTISYAQMILDNELIAGLRRMWQGITLHDLTEEVELIKSQIPRGNFMSSKHTIKNYKRHWYPEILIRETYDTWIETGEPIKETCLNKAKKVLEDNKFYALSTDIESELETIMRKHISDFHF